MGIWGIIFAVLLALAILIFSIVITRIAKERSALVKENLRLYQQIQNHDDVQNESSHWVEVLRLVFERTTDRLILVNEHMDVLYMNQTARELFATSGAKDLPSQSLIAVTHRHELEDAARTTLQDEAPILMQIKLESQTYSVFTDYLMLDGRRYALLMFQDVSEIRRLGRARREMVGNISHELRTPLTSIRLMIDTIRREEKLSKSLDTLIFRISDEVETLQQMADELLDLSMIEAGRAEFIYNSADVHDLAKGAVKHLKEQAKRKKIKVKNEIPEGLMVLVDNSQVERVIKNLIHNAIKFTPEGGKITLEGEALNESMIRIDVVDNGIGIPDFEKDRVFERFYRGDRSRNTSGTGLGLSIAKHIVQAHGGSIWIEDAEGFSGSRFIFTIPADL